MDIHKRIDKEVRAFLTGAPLPGLGDPSKTVTVALTEPELYSIAAMIGFAKDACANVPDSAGDTVALVKLWWSHYAPTLEALSCKLEKLS